MASPSDIKDPAFRAAVEEAERLLDEGDYTKAAQTCVETFVKLVNQTPDLLPPGEMPDVQPLNPDGQPRIAEGTKGLAAQDAVRKWRQNWWPGTGSISVVLTDMKPEVKYAKERVSMSEALGYFEFLVQQLANAQRK